MKASVTIGIPVFNEDKNLNNLMEYIHDSQFDFGVKEIIIICSGCTDNSVEVAKKWKIKENKIKLIVEKTRRGKLFAMNKILKIARGEYIIFVNSDTLPKKNALNFISGHFKATVGAVTGRPIPLQKTNTIVGYFQNYIWDLHHEISLSYDKISGELFVIRKKLVKEIPIGIINDDAYFTALLRHKYSIIYEPRAETCMVENLNLQNYIKKRRRIASGFQQLEKLNMNVSVPISLLIKILLLKMIRKPNDIPKMIAAVFVEIYCNTLAFFDIKRNRIDYKWDKTNVA